MKHYLLAAALITAASPAMAADNPVPCLNLVRAVAAGTRASATAQAVDFYGLHVARTKENVEEAESLANLANEALIRCSAELSSKHRPE